MISAWVRSIDKQTMMQQGITINNGMYISVNTALQKEETVLQVFPFFANITFDHIL